MQTLITVNVKIEYIFLSSFLTSPGNELQTGCEHDLRSCDSYAWWSSSLCHVFLRCLMGLGGLCCIPLFLKCWYLMKLFIGCRSPAIGTLSTSIKSKRHEIKSDPTPFGYEGTRTCPDICVMPGWEHASPISLWLIRKNFVSLFYCGCVHIFLCMFFPLNACYVDLCCDLWSEVLSEMHEHLINMFGVVWWRAVRFGVVWPLTAGSLLHCTR